MHMIMSARWRRRRRRHIRQTAVWFDTSDARTIAIQRNFSSKSNNTQYTQWSRTISREIDRGDRETKKMKNVQTNARPICFGYFFLFDRIEHLPSTWIMWKPRSNRKSTAEYNLFIECVWSRMCAFLWKYLFDFMSSEMIAGTTVFGKIDCYDWKIAFIDAIPSRTIINNESMNVWS